MTGGLDTYIKAPLDKRDQFSIAAGYSIVAHTLLSGFQVDGYMLGRGQKFRKYDVNTTAVACRGLEDVSKKYANKPRHFVLQYGGGDIAVGIRDSLADVIANCATKASFRVIDSFGRLRSLYEITPKEFKNYYAIHGEVHGHMSRLG